MGERITLSLSTATSERRFLVYTSAGDRSAVKLWLEGRRNFDLWVTAYGDDPERYRDDVDYMDVRQGGKFQNLRSAWFSNPETFARYDAVLVLDDDVVIDADGISRLFELREEYSLTILQPAFLGFGKVSHPVTRRSIWQKLRYVDFVEVTCPLFRRDALETFLGEYDGRLVGWGIDFWYLHVLRQDPSFLAAVVDSVPCVNPLDSVKGGVREIRRLQPDKTREGEWLELKSRLGIELADTKKVRRRVRGSLLSCLTNAVWTPLRRRLQQRRLQADFLQT